VQVRTKYENMTLVGAISGPSKPDNLKLFLDPIREELDRLWGMDVTVFDAHTGSNTTVRALAAAVIHDGQGLRDLACQKEAGENPSLRLISGAHHATEVQALAQRSSACDPF
jgi:Transposase family tnp2